jgi:hypothetical protein
LVGIDYLCTAIQKQGIMKVKYKISYKKRWGEDGTCYRQMINVRMTERDLDYFNGLVCQGKAHGGERFKMYAQELKVGLNYCTNTITEYFAYMTNILSDSRYKNLGINTIIKVTLLKTVKKK